MRQRNYPVIRLMLSFLFIFFSNFASAQSVSILYTFTGEQDGANPTSPLLLTHAGSLIGAAQGGGGNGNGTVFQLTPGARGWTLNVLHSFLGHTDGVLPNGPIIRDRQGNLYGTTFKGGAFGQGEVFELTRGSDGTWTNNILYSFTGGDDGGEPASGLVFDKHGNLFGTAGNGKYERGVVFELSPNGDGTWTESVLHAFMPLGDGKNPGGRLVLDRAGNLYGVTVVATDSNQGIVFRLSPDGSGGWTESVIYSFQGGSGGGEPTSGLILAGNTLYGTTFIGGDLSCNPPNGCGGVFQLRPNGSGGWNEEVIFPFSGGANGAFPRGVIADSSGNLYGETVGTPFGDANLVFELVKGSNEQWTEKVLYTVATDGKDFLSGGLVLDSSGNLFGTTGTEGPQLAGTVFEVMP